MGNIFLRKIFAAIVLVVITQELKKWATRPDVPAAR